jgi:hypothetical protein
MDASEEISRADWDGRQVSYVRDDLGAYDGDV